MTTTSDPRGTRTARTITAEGDARSVTRRAKQYDARAAITWDPHDDSPALELHVSPFGVWELTARRVGTRGGTTLARGHVTGEGFTLDE